LTSTRILVADDHDVVRHGVRALLEAEPGWTVCGEARDGREAVLLASQLRPDVVVLDIGMPELNGLEATRQILKALPATEILVLTMHDSEQIVREVVAAGARGYVLKSDAGRSLVTAVHALRQHKPFLNARASEVVLDGFRRGAADAAAQRPALTPREREIVQLLAEGRTNKEIAGRLGISAKTAESHRTNVMRKLGVHSIGELVRHAIREGLIDA
jgi:DNA-binding NarL/FixJ family response regulator